VDARTVLLAAVVLAVGGAGLVVSQGIEDVGCELEAAAVPVVVEGVSKGRSGTLADGCQDVVQTWQDDPTATVELTIEADGRTVTREVDFFELTEPAPQPIDAGVDLRHALACFHWQADMLRRMCLEGSLDPPRR
jgi:hypothetical protein